MRPLIGLTCGYVTEGEVALHRVRGTYVEAVAAAGGVPVLLPAVDSPEEAGELLARLDGLLLPGGKDLDPTHYGEPPHPGLEAVEPRDDRTELTLTRQAVKANVPLLAICRGIQVLNVALGGSLYQDLRSQVPDALDHRPARPRGEPHHPLTITAGSRLEGITGRREVGANSFHHQAIKELGAGLVATAWAPDGIVEAVELHGHPFALGVQCHPEDLWPHEPAWKAVFQAFVEAARARGERRR